MANSEALKTKPSKNSLLIRRPVILELIDRADRQSNRSLTTAVERLATPLRDLESGPNEIYMYTARTAPKSYWHASTGSDDSYSEPDSKGSD